MTRPRQANSGGRQPPLDRDGRQRLPSYPNVAAARDCCSASGRVAGAFRMKVALRMAEQRIFAMPIERRGADAALRFGFGATRRVFEGAHIRLTPVRRKRITAEERHHLAYDPNCTLDRLRCGRK